MGQNGSNSNGISRNNVNGMKELIEILPKDSYFINLDGTYTVFCDLFITYSMNIIHGSPWLTTKNSKWCFPGGASRITSDLRLWRIDHYR